MLCHRLKTCATQKDTQVENLCYGRPQGAARAREPALLASAGRMPKRSRHRVNEGQDARSERPAMGMGSPVAQVGNLSMLCHRLTTCATRERTQVENMGYAGRRHRLKTCATGDAELHELDSGVLPARLRSPGAIGVPLELLSGSAAPLIRP